VDQEHLGVTESQQISGGVTQGLPPLLAGADLSVDVRGYWSRFTDQVHGTEWLPTFGQSILGDGEAFGGEVWLLFDFPTEAIQGTLAYSLSRVQWRNQGTEGQTTPSDIDSTHGLALNLQYHLPRNYSLGARARYYTGFPYTTFSADVAVPDVGGYIGVGETPWAGRAPHFVQIDFRVSKRWRVDKRVQLEAFIDVQNVTFRSNVDRLQPGLRPTQPAAATALPFFPSLGVGGSF
jgi:hypothetical protein